MSSGFTVFGRKLAISFQSRFSQRQAQVLAGLAIVSSICFTCGIGTAVGQDQFFAETAEIVDGDSFWVTTADRRIEVRLWGIDCPEWTQPYAREAKELTAELLMGRNLRVEVQDTDIYGRKVAMVYAGPTSVNEELVRSGAAWVFPRYCRQSICTKWKELQADAQQKGIGLWHLPKPEPPWNKRRKN